MKKDKEYKFFKILLIVICFFIGIGAVWGATCMFIDPTGKLLQMDKMLPYFKVLPFSEYLFEDYIFSGIALLIVNGITNIIAGILIIKNKKSGIIAGMIFGITLMLWIVIQFIIFPMNFLSVTYFIFGFIQMIVGYTTLVSFLHKNISFDENLYKNIGSDKKKLVVYFSRMGYVKKIAYKKANETGAEIYEIKPTEKIEGISGFWWCGRFGMHKWEMPIEKVNINFEDYDEVTICSPIWVFNLSAPVRAFCKQTEGKIKKVDYILLHFTKTDYLNAVEEMDTLLKVKAKNITTMCCRLGKIIKIKNVEY